MQYKREDTEELSVWSDIVKDVVVFMSDDVEIYDVLDDVRPRDVTNAGTTTQVEGKALWHDSVALKFELTQSMI